MIDFSEKMKFTPGPWSAEYKSSIDKINILQEDIEEHFYVVASIDNPFDFDEYNAYLLASAPELLQELTYRYTQHYCGCGNPACKRCEDDRETE